MVGQACARRKHKAVAPTGAEVGGRWDPPAARVDLLHGRLDDLLADGACDLVLHHSSISRHRDLNASTPWAARDEKGWYAQHSRPGSACERAGGAKMPLFHGVACTAARTHAPRKRASRKNTRRVRMRLGSVPPCVFEYHDFARRGTRARARPARARPPRAARKHAPSLLAGAPPADPHVFITFSLAHL